MSRIETELTPRQKYQRINNPKCLIDYGLSLSIDELKTFKAGRDFLKIVRQKRSELTFTEKFAKLFGVAISRQFDEDIKAAIKGAKI